MEVSRFISTTLYSAITMFFSNQPQEQLIIKSLMHN